MSSAVDAPAIGAANMAQPPLSVTTAGTHSNGGARPPADAPSPSPIKQQAGDGLDDDEDAFPRKKRRKLAVDERKRAVRA